jgi:sugar/nucleoside kinase (ribokinase family)
MTSPPTVLTFGEALVGYASVEDNLRTATQFTRFPGGADLNVAVGLTHLGVSTTSPTQLISSESLRWYAAPPGLPR